MNIRVFVTLKPNVLDPQGMAIQRALVTMGHSRVKQVRQGKYFEIEWDGNANNAEEREKIEAIASQVLANPVTEVFRIEWPETRRS